MTTALLERRPEIMERAAELQSQVAAMQEKLQTLLRGVGGELHIILNWDNAQPDDCLINRIVQRQVGRRSSYAA